MTTESDPPSDDQSATKPFVQFDYLKSNYFRTIRADGAIGAVLPSGDLHMALFSERPAIPKITRHERTVAGLSEPIEMEGRAGYVRELECDVFLNVNSARSLVAWLQKRIEEIEARTNAVALMEAQAAKSERP